MTPLTTKAAEIRAGLEGVQRRYAHPFATISQDLLAQTLALIEQQAAELAEARKEHRNIQTALMEETARTIAAERRATTAESERDEARAALQVAKDGWRDAEAEVKKLSAERAWIENDGGKLQSERNELLREKERLTEERDEARAYLKAFCRACVDSEFDRNPVGVHEANPSLGWIFTLDDMDVCPQQHITGGQVRRAMEIVGFDKLKIEPAARTISDELSENRAAARTAEATASSRSERIAVLEAALRPFARLMSDIPDDLPDDLWTTCQTYEYDMPEDMFLGLIERGAFLKDRKTRLSLWIDGHSLGDFRRARSALAPLGEE